MPSFWVSSLHASRSFIARLGVFRERIGGRKVGNRKRQEVTDKWAFDPDEDVSSALRRQGII